MFKKLLLFLFPLALSGCFGPSGEWGSEWGRGDADAPSEMADPAELYGAEPEDTSVKNVAVLLPLSGAGGDLGIGIQHAVEIAFFQKQPKNITVSFHDLSGRTEDKHRVIDMAISSQPDIIIGPLFADDVELLKSRKPDDVPAITFTSAQGALGGGIFTMALLPNQAVEAIVKQIKAEGREHLVIMAPDTQTGHLLANSALESAKIYNLDIAGMYLFGENDAPDMKDLAEKASLSESRKENLMRAKAILSDILIKERLTTGEKESVKTQLEDLNKRDTLGEVPYDAVLILGNAADSKTLGAYLRYYDVNAAATAFYGSALWDAEAAYRDSSLSGGEYAGLPRISDAFLKLYAEIEGTKPNRLNTMGYDAAMLSIKALTNRKKPVAAHLLDPSGYIGLDGLVRLRPNGSNERALQILQLNGVRLPFVKKPAAQNFTTPLYKTSAYDLSKPVRKKLTSDGYNPLDYIRIPQHLDGKYQSKTIGVIYDPEIQYAAPDAEHVEAVADAESVSGEAPAKLDPVDRKLIDEVKLRAVN